MLSRVIWQKLSDVSRVLTASLIGEMMMEAENLQSVSTRLQGATSQKTASQLRIITNEVYIGYRLSGNYTM
jgi:hypothetical protein